MPGEEEGLGLRRAELEGLSRHLRGGVVEATPEHPVTAEMGLEQATLVRTFVDDGELMGGSDQDVDAGL